MCSKKRVERQRDRVAPKAEVLLLDRSPFLDATICGTSVAPVGLAALERTRSKTDPRIARTGPKDGRDCPTERVADCSSTPERRRALPTASGGKCGAGYARATLDRMASRLRQVVGDVHAHGGEQL